MKSGLREAGEIVLLVGAILDTITQGVLVVCTFFLWTPVAAVVIPLLWVARKNALKGRKGWIIYGIVHGALSGWVTLAGHIIMLIDYNKTEREKINI